ncbi:MAG: adenylate/guanylate cyclase domain-containing protein [Acidimicrobiia bacterium]|nr:adenylate/guanylate cyclase domain-containing protein [Acidimicrobiia bacterium]
MESLRRFWGFLLEAGAYEEETRDQRGRRRIVVGILWVSVPGLIGASLSGEGPWVMAMDGLKAATHLGMLLALWVWPRRIAALFMALSVLDLAADVTISLLLGGFYDSGLQVTWSLVSVVGLLVVASVRAAAVYLAVFLAAMVFVAVFSDSVEATYAVADPQADAAFTLVAVTLFIFAGLFYFVRQRDRFQRESDDLLHNILPDEIANRLKDGAGELIADHFDDVSVLFLDVVGFTPLSANMTPAELVGLLDEIFSDFDAFVEELGLEKIKTVGDEYMVAAGVPLRRSDHAHATADLALQIQDRLATHQYAGHRIIARMGINSGPVVAGIIGTRKFSYDLWGDVVNTASRMESHGLPGKIQISPATYAHLKADFECESRGTIEVKGKGELETWFLQSRRVSAPGPSGA